MVEWTTGMEYWNGLIYAKNIVKYHIASNFWSFLFSDISKNITSTTIKLVEIKCVIS